MINRIVKKIGKGRASFILIILIIFVIMGLYQTFSLMTESTGISYSTNTKTYTFVIGNITEDEIVISENDSKYIDILIKNDKEIDLSYALYYTLETKNENLIIGYLKETEAKPSGTILASDTKIISLKAINNSNEITKIKIGVNTGTLNGGELKKSGARITEEIKNLDNELANEPALDNNLIPVYYDSNLNKWFKADESNTNPKYKWYDYSSETKMWANAVIVTENTRTNYLNEKSGTIINDQDILGFFVWIPRYKYKVWNQEPTYEAKEQGIILKFEQGTKTTGNLNCNYNSYLSNTKNDLCQIDNTKENDGVWYTHPAFTYGSKELTGIWVGKFETTGTLETPTVLPDKMALRNVTISKSYSLAKKINTYLVNSNQDAHLLKNIEWGAITYLTHSKYGLCNEEGCSILNNNNSLNGITGRSSGTSNIDIPTTDNGTYSYEGNKMENDNKTEEKDLNSLASTTKNIYGIYDLSGSLSEYVMGNMVDTKNNFNIQSAGTDWTISNIPNKYYDTYSYSTNNNVNQRGKTGDATEEITTINNEVITTWNNTKEVSFLNNDNAWLIRGDSSKNLSSMFNYQSSNGDKNNEYGFRISLS